MRFQSAGVWMPEPSLNPIRTLEPTSRAFVESCSSAFGSPRPPQNPPAPRPRTADPTTLSHLSAALRRRHEAVFIGWPRGSSGSDPAFRWRSSSLPMDNTCRSNGTSRMSHGGRRWSFQKRSQFQVTVGAVEFSLHSLPARCDPPARYLSFKTPS